MEEGKQNKKKSGRELARRRKNLDEENLKRKKFSGFRAFWENFGKQSFFT